jgi:hypothetical protein
MFCIVSMFLRCSKWAMTSKALYWEVAYWLIIHKTKGQYWSNDIKNKVYLRDNIDIHDIIHVSLMCMHMYFNCTELSFAYILKEFKTSWMNLNILCGCCCKRWIFHEKRGKLGQFTPCQRSFLKTNTNRFISAKMLKLDTNHRKHRVC